MKLPSTFIFECDTDSGNVRPVKCRWWFWGKRPKGVTGLCHYRDGILAVFNSSPSQLVYLSLPDYRMINRWVLKLGHSPHSITVYDDKAYIANTGMDGIIEFDITTKTETIYWRDNGGGRDSIHINSLFWHNGELYASAFGTKPTGGMWSDAKQGYVINLGTGEKVIFPIYHPHSARWALDSVFWCESSYQRVVSSTYGVLEGIRGYARGLVVTESQLVVGVSTGRRKSKSTGADMSESSLRFQANCGIEYYSWHANDLADSKLQGYIDMYPWGNEIYDILQLG